MERCFVDERKKIKKNWGHRNFLICPKFLIWRIPSIVFRTARTVIYRLPGKIDGDRTIRTITTFFHRLLVLIKSLDCAAFIQLELVH